MQGPSCGLTPEETTRFISELESRWRAAGDGEKERLAWTLGIWIRMVAQGAHAPEGDVHGCRTEAPNLTCVRVDALE